MDINWSVDFDVTVNGQDTKFWDLPDDVREHLLHSIAGDSYSGTIYVEEDDNNDEYCQK